METDPKMDAKIKLLKELIVIDREKFLNLPKEVQGKVFAHLTEDTKGEELQSNYQKWFDSVDPGTGILDFEQFQGLMKLQNDWSDEKFGGHVNLTDEDLEIRWSALQFSDKGGYTKEDIKEYKKLKN